MPGIETVLEMNASPKKQLLNGCREISLHTILSGSEMVLGCYWVFSYKFLMLDRSPLNDKGMKNFCLEAKQSCLVQIFGRIFFLSFFFVIQLLFFYLFYFIFINFFYFLKKNFFSVLNTRSAFSAKWNWHKHFRFKTLIGIELK